MKLSVGIVGLPNVGKSTLFNALIKRQQALAANYPFATVEPNIGIVEVPDERLIKLAEVVKKNEDIFPPIKPATIEFVDIAGLVTGAAKGEGLGNKFLAHIRECDLICHVLRSFDDSDVVLTGKMNPAEDLKTVRMELILKDIETVKKTQSAKIKVHSLGQKIQIEKFLEKVLGFLNKGTMLNKIEWREEELEILKPMQLLTIKPEIFCINISEDQLTKTSNFKLKVPDISQNEIIFISAKIESELASLSADDQKEYLNQLGLKQSGIERLAQAAYKKLDLISFLTAGKIECRAWTVKKNTPAYLAAGVIHSDFSNNFIKAKVIDWQGFVKYGGWKKSGELGKIRQEGRNYLIKDGEVVEFMIGR